MTPPSTKYKKFTFLIDNKQKITVAAHDQEEALQEVQWVLRYKYNKRKRSIISFIKEEPMSRRLE